ncbi:MAG: hypothetical protein Q7J37_01195, partial [Candidatus Omnitrophota bacterium]|nr:hypothetical protein [Candidatus Omnitrophota bacterium]
IVDSHKEALHIFEDSYLNTITQPSSRSSSPIKEKGQPYRNFLYFNDSGKNSLGRISRQFYKVRDNIVKFLYISMLGIQ